MARGMGNPFYVQPGGDMTRGLYGLTNQVNQIGQQRRVDEKEQMAAQKEQEAMQRAQEIKAEAQSVYASGDPEAIRQFRIKYPEYGKVVQEMVTGKFKEGQEDIFDQGYRFLSADDPESMGNVLTSMESMLTQEQYNPEQKQMIQSFVETARKDPEAAKRQAQTFLVTGDFDRYENFAKSFGLEGAEKKEIPAEQQAFENLIKDFSPEEQVKARKVKAGLEARAVGSSDMTIQQLGIADLIGDTQATMAERKKFGEMQGSQRSQAIDKGFDKVQKLQQNISNLDNAIAAVDSGAGTGAIEKRFPSIKESSVLLDQVQGALALDVIGSVTFGALSEGELNLAKAIAIPTGLEGPALKEWLQNKKDAQKKLLNYFKEQIDFLDQGGSVAGFLRKKSRESRDGNIPSVTTQAEFDALPSGAVYIEDGKQYRKP